MSYILDALRKSEEERRRGELPDPRDFSHAPVASRSARRYLWPALVVGLLLINLAGLLYWAPWQSRPGDLTGQPAPVASTIPAGTAPQNAPHTAPTLAVQPIPVAQQPGAQPVNQPATQRVAQPAAQPVAQPVAQPIAQPMPVTAQPLPRSVAAQPTPVVQSTPAIATPHTTPLPVAQATPRPALPAELPANPPAVQATPQATPQPTPAVVARSRPHVPRLGELPTRIRNQIPELVFSSHMYSSTARYRSIIINGRRLKEGQFLAGDLVVHEITESGVILNFKDTLFEVDVLAQW